MILKEAIQEKRERDAEILESFAGDGEGPGEV